MSKEFVELIPFFWVTQSTAYAATNSGIIINGSEACLIDPAVTPYEIEAIGTFVQDKGATVQTIFVTHSHFPNAQVVTQATYLQAVEAQASGLQTSLASWEREEGIVRDTPFVVPQPHKVFDRTLSIHVGSQGFELIHAPGHHRDMYVVYHRASALLWAADMLSDLEIPFVEQHLGDYRKTLTMLSELHVEILVPGHGSWTVEVDEIGKRFTRDQAYLDEVNVTVQTCLAEGLSVEQTVERCAGIYVNRPEQNGSAHRDNVESAWLELGGESDSTTLGWGKYY
jgi:glyoxylase-like metal-dependent hydrolase (beta-lactamase superfamily II)